MDDSTSDEILSFCNDCQRDNAHDLVATCSRRQREPDGRSILETWQLLQCRGCRAIKAFVTEDSTDFKTPRQIHHPPCQRRRLPQWRGQVPLECQELIRETYEAMHADCLTLSMMGTRAILDRVLEDMVGGYGTFVTRLQQAVDGGFLTEAEKETVYSAIDAGNAASHRGFIPTHSQLDDVLDIVEHALMSKYVLASVSGRLKSSVPPRK